MNRDGSVPRDLTVHRRRLAVASAIVVASYHTTARVIDRETVNRYLAELEHHRVHRYIAEKSKVNWSDPVSKRNFNEGHRYAHEAYSNPWKIWLIVARICDYSAKVQRILVPEHPHYPENLNDYRTRHYEEISRLAYQYFD